MHTTNQHQFNGITNKHMSLYNQHTLHNLTSTITNTTQLLIYTYLHYTTLEITNYTLHITDTHKYTYILMITRVMNLHHHCQNQLTRTHLTLKTCWTRLYTFAVNTNNILQIRKLAGHYKTYTWAIYTDPSHFSLDQSLEDHIPYITNNSTTQHSYQINYSIDTTLYNTITTGFNQKQSPASTITAARHLTL